MSSSPLFIISCKKSHNFPHGVRLKKTAALLLLVPRDQTFWTSFFILFNLFAKIQDTVFRSPETEMCKFADKVWIAFAVLALKNLGLSVEQSFEGVCEVLFILTDGAGPR